MKRTVLSRYWLFQTGGCAAYALINLFSAGVPGMLSGAIAWRLLFFIEAGIFFLHLMREAIHRAGILRMPLRRQVYHFMLFMGVFPVLMGLAQTPFGHLCGLRVTDEGEPSPLHRLFFTNFAQAVLALFLWNVTYIVYHQVKKSRRQKLDALQLEALVKALELRAI